MLVQGTQVVGCFWSCFIWHGLEILCVSEFHPPDQVTEVVVGEDTRIALV